MPDYETQNAMLKEAAERLHKATDGVAIHDHACHCGTELEPHDTGERRCVRRMVPAPQKLQNDFWLVDGQELTGYTLREQRGYHQHPCGCWSRWPDSVNSIEA